MSTIWFLGEALIDFVPTQSDYGPAFAPRPGGSPFNATKAAAQAGADARFLGAISTDMFGETLLDELKAHGVGTDSTPRTDAPSTLAFVKLTNGIARYAFFNNQSATATMNPDPGAFRPGAGDIVSFGSISLIDKPGADAIAAFALAQGDETLVALDPNARTSMTHDVPAWRARIGAMTEKAGLIKLSDEDLEAIAPGATPDAYAQERLTAGAGLVLFTVGDGGVHGYCKSGQVHVPARQTTIVDTVGAGDTLMGGVLAELILRELNTPSKLQAIDLDALEAALKFAVTAASINCERSGCNPPKRQEVLDTMAAEA
ncbi:MAG: carbohydrate kinase [Cohaesibacteraceae bacterium]